MTPTSFEPSDEMTKAAFDRQKPEDFERGPWIERQTPCGGNYKDVLYMPNKRAYGWLRDGRFVWCWATGTNVRKEEPT